MEATVIQKKANVSVMQATPEKGLHNFNICILLYFLYYLQSYQNRLDTSFWVTTHQLRNYLLNVNLLFVVNAIM